VAGICRVVSQQRRHTESRRFLEMAMWTENRSGETSDVLDFDEHGYTLDGKFLPSGHVANAMAARNPELARNLYARSSATEN